MTDAGITRSRRVAIIQAEASTKLILTEFHVDAGPPSMRNQLQLTTFGATGAGHGAYARLTQYQARKLLEALEGWLNGREPAA